MAYLIFLDDVPRKIRMRKKKNRPNRKPKPLKATRNRLNHRLQLPNQKQI